VKVTLLDFLQAKFPQWVTTREIESACGGELRDITDALRASGKARERSGIGLAATLWKFRP
jgi:hypothetical protein